MPIQKLNQQSQEFKDAASKFASGVTVVAVKNEDNFHAMTVSAFTTISMEPLMIMVSISNKSKMHDILKQQKRFSVSILNKNQTDISNHFAGKKQSDDFAQSIMIDVDDDKKEEYKIVSGSLAFFLCDLEEIYEKGDHTLFFGKVNKSWTNPIPNGSALIYFSRNYHSV
jgi:flavin reductase (DIM6/NTAB) family NADH-FMN oxidoreductase RutF